MSIWTRLDRIAADVEKLDKQVKAVSNSPQSQRTSVEGGSIDFNDADGNLMAIVGGQSDGSNTIRHVDGPTPPVPAGLSSHVDGPIIQTTWDGTFEDDTDATFDWSHLEVLAVGPNNEQLRGTINDVTGASVSLAATTSGEWAVYARSVSRAEKRSVDGDAGTVEVKVTDLSGAIEDVQQSANGKNNVTYSESPPTEADEGIVGDTWFVGATDSESGNWNVVAQYQYTADGWTQVELSHEVIATVDLGKATVGELDGIRIMGQTVRGEQLSGDAIDGKVITGGTYRTTDGTGQWSDDGLFINQPDGTSMVRFPTDGSPLSLTASDTQIERASISDLDLTDGAVRSGGTFALASGVTPPASPPGLELGWEKVATFTQPSPGLPFDWVGLANWGTKWVRAVNVLGSAGDTLDAFEVYNADGSFEKQIALDINPHAGVTVIGDVAYTLGTVPGDANRQWVHGFNLNTGVRVTRWQFTRFTLSNQAKIAIGNDGTNLVVAGVHPTSNTLYVMKYNPATGAQVGVDMRDTNYDVQYTKEIQGVYVTGSIAYAAHQKDTRRYSISGDTLTRTDNGWRNPETSAAGLVLASTPHLVSTSGVLYRGSLFADATLEACYTWWDGVRETTPSPVASLATQAARVVSVSVGRRAGLQKRLYYRTGSGNWERTTLGEDETATTIYAPNTLNPKYPLPTVNTFPNADPALLTSTNEKFQVFGDGSGRWGPLTFNADGTMTSTAIPAWVPLTTFASGFAPASWSFPPAYRIWPDGKVEWRGVIAGAISGTTVIATIPVSARAAYSTQFAAATGNPGSGRAMVSRLEFGRDGVPGDMRALPNGVTVNFISLDGIYYYLT